MRNRPPTSRIRSRPEMASFSTLNSGSVRRITQAKESSSRMRVPMASPSPRIRAFWR
ncbi:hypothetical protein D3C78_1891520 [compost metagenome]